MDYMTVSEVSKTYDISARMLRYYEQKGLIVSSRKENYAYRIYDEAAVSRIQFILIMRKLRVSLKQIATMLEQDNSLVALDVLKQNIEELDEEMSSLETIRKVLQQFMNRINEEQDFQKCLDVLESQELIQLSKSLVVSKPKLKEDNVMSELNEVKDVPEDKMNVRIVLLPPYTVAAYQYIGENPEETVGDVMDKFVRESKLYEKKPDARMFGFNHPNPSEQRPVYGYESWVTIPEDMEVPEPLVKKTYQGGLYATHTIEFPNFHEWKLLVKWVEDSDKYDANYSELGEEIMGGCLEEHLNWIYSSHMGWPENGIDGKLDLLLPIKQK